MLAENMQRADLTEPEQAEGFQLMLNLGDTVSSISEQTGFSESTIRRRLKMSQYDMEQVKKSYDAGMRLEDFEALEKINDPAVREKLVENFKPNNFGICRKTSASGSYRVSIYENRYDRLKA